VNRTFFFDSAFLPDGWRNNVRLRVRDGVIEQVNLDASATVGDEREALVVPGLPNVHSHAFQRAAAGLSERLGATGADDFWSWREAMYRFLARLEPDDLEAIAAYAYADMLEAGFTSVGEFHYIHCTPRGDLYSNPAELALRHLAAAEATGIGITLLPVFYESANFGGVAPTTAQRRFITDLETFANIVERLRSFVSQKSIRSAVGIAPHSLRAVRFDHLTALLREHTTGPVHIHAAEQMKEVDECVAFCGLRPIDWLLRNTEFNPRWCVVHATHLNGEEVQGLAKSGAVAGLCPITEANLGDGVFPAIAYNQAGGRSGIGTDSHVYMDAAGELRQLEYSQRLTSLTRNALASQKVPSTGRALYAAALIGGAQALGQQIGVIAPGYRADFLILDHTHSDLVMRVNDAVLDTWLFTVGRQLVVESQQIVPAEADSAHGWLPCQGGMRAMPIVAV